MIGKLATTMLVALLSLSPSPTPSAGTGRARPAPAMLPLRRLDCSLGRIANFDPSGNQSFSDYRYDERHAFGLVLPAIPVRTGPPPEATAPPEPVDPGTRITADPDGIAREAERRPFDRVVDDWPNRVEMTTPISAVAVNLIVIDRIDPASGHAVLFMTRANDAVTFDLGHLYIGICRVTLGAAADTLSRADPAARG